LDGPCDDGDVPLTTVDDSSLDFGIKWMMTANAIRLLGIDVFLVNDENMEPDDLKAYQIIGSTHLSDPSASGWLCFCKTRAVNAKFFHWYTTTIMPQFVLQCRQLLPEDNQQHSYMIADGEALQIQPYDKDDVAFILEEYKIDIGEGPASCINTIGNACDRNNLFKAAKKTLKSVT
jgi:hypothetical protein